MRTRVGYCPAYCCHEIGGLTPSVSRLLGSGFGKAPEGFATQELDIRPGYRFGREIPSSAACCRRHYRPGERQRPVWCELAESSPDSCVALGRACAPR